MYSAGRHGMTEALGLEGVGLTADHRGRITVDERYRTAVPHIYAVGDVIGFPALAATSMEQGRLAAHDAVDTLEHGPNARDARRALVEDLVLVEDVLERRADGQWERTTIRRSGIQIRRTVKLADLEDRRHFGVDGSP